MLKACSGRRVKCDEARPSCKKCLASDRTCEWFEATPAITPPRLSPESDQSEKRVLLPAQNASYVPGAAAADIQPSSLGVGLDARERSALGFFINRTARDLGYSFPSNEWISCSLQLGHEEPALRYAMTALGSMHQARRAYTHTSMVPVIDPEHLRYALDGYGKAMLHLRRRIERCPVSNRSQATNMILLSCLLFFCFEQLQGEQATACLHMQKGQRIIKELLSGPDSESNIEPFLKRTYSLFSGFEDINFSVFQSQTPTSIQEQQSAVEIAYSIPNAFDRFGEANKHLKRLESARANLRRELIRLADEALRSLKAPPTDPAVLLCLQHCLSRAVDLSTHEHLIRDLHALQYGYDAWMSAFANTTTDLGGSTHAWAVIRMQCLVSRFNIRTTAEPSEKICDLYEDDFIEILDLAEQCLLVFPSTTDSLSSLSGVLSNSGYGLALSTDLLPQIALCGFKSRRSSTRERSIELLTLANKHEGVYQSAILARFVRRPMNCEQRRAMGLGYIPGPDGFEASQIPEEARVADSVFAQVKYRPRCINMISCRFACNEMGEPRLEISEDICDLFTGDDVSNTTYDIPAPEKCQQSIEFANAGFMIPSPSPSNLSGLRIEFSCPSSSDCIQGILPMHPVPANEKISTSSPSSSSSTSSAMRPLAYMLKDSEYSPSKSYPKAIATSGDSWSSGALKNYPGLRIPAGSLPEEDSSRTEGTLQSIPSRGHIVLRTETGSKSPSKIPIMHCP